MNLDTFLKNILINLNVQKIKFGYIRLGGGSYPEKRKSGNVIDVEQINEINEMK